MTEKVCKQRYLSLSKLFVLAVIAVFLFGAGAVAVHAKEAAEQTSAAKDDKGFLGSITGFFSSIVNSIFGIHQNNATPAGEPGKTANENPSETGAVATPPKQETVPAGTKASGQGYATGPLAMVVPPAQLIMDRLGQVKQAPGTLEVIGRQYEANGIFLVTINGADFNANAIKVISNLKVKNGVGQHSGTIDVDIDAVPGGHLTLEYKGSATVIGSTIASSGNFKTTKTTGTFAGLVAEGTYSMIILESGAALGSPVTVSITTASAAAAQPAAAGATTGATTPAPGITISGGVSGPGYPTGPLALTVSGTQMMIDNPGAVKPGEIAGRSYNATGVPVTINGVGYTATEVKLVSSLKTKAGAGQHFGTLDVDIDTIPGGHLALEYKGTATIAGSTITSGGTFKTTKTTGSFAGLVADGTYTMTIIETGSAIGSPASVTIATRSAV